MAIIFDEYDKYGIGGKIVDINDSSTLTISVTSPFVREIKFQCSSEYYKLLHPPVTSKYNWIDWVSGDGHPSVREASAYYNTSHKCFYKKESGRESEWERADFEDIYNDDDSYLFEKHLDTPEKYQFFLYKYKSILHKGQLCHFSAYAIHRINRDWKSIQNNEVERHPEDYTWIYDPDSFYGEKWDAESIDGLVKEIRPSRETLNQLLASYDAEDQEAKRKDRTEWWEGKKRTCKDAVDRLNQNLKEYKPIYTFIFGVVGGSLIMKFILPLFKKFILPLIGE